MACLSAASVEVTLGHSDCSSVSMRDKHWVDKKCHLCHSRVTEEVSGDADDSNQMVGIEEPLFVLRVICSVGTLLVILRLERICNWRAWVKPQFSRFWSSGHPIAHCSTSCKCLITENKRQTRKGLLWVDMVTVSHIASPDWGLFQGQIPLTFSAVLF